MVSARSSGKVRRSSRLGITTTDNFYQASCICMDALSAYISRYERIVRSAAEEEAPADAHATIVLPRTLERTAELQRLANILAHIATEPARDLYDALQLVWIVSVALQHESNASSLSLRTRGSITCCPTTVPASARAPLTRGSRSFSSASTSSATPSWQCAPPSLPASLRFPIGYNLVVGGVDASGDALNELSLLLHRSSARHRLLQPNLSLRIHKGTRTSFCTRQLR